MKLTRLKSFYAECVRVFRITKKPTNEEFKAIVKVSGLGILLIGLVGFIIHELQENNCITLVDKSEVVFWKLRLHTLIHTFAIFGKPQYLGLSLENAESHWLRFLVVVSTLVVVNFYLDRESSLSGAPRPHQLRAPVGGGFLFHPSMLPPI